MCIYKRVFYDPKEYSCESVLDFNLISPLVSLSKKRKQVLSLSIHIFCSYKHSLYTYFSVPIHIELNLLCQLQCYQKLLCEGKPDFWSRFMLRLLSFILMYLILGNSFGSSGNASQLHSWNREEQSMTVLFSCCICNRAKNFKLWQSNEKSWLNNNNKQTTPPHLPLSGMEIRQHKKAALVSQRDFFQGSMAVKPFDISVTKAGTDRNEFM